MYILNKLSEHDESIKTLQQSSISIDAYTKTETNNLLNKKANTDTTYTKTEVNNLLNKKVNADTIYNKTETNDLLNEKADVDDVYTKTEADNLLNKKVNADATYSKTEVDNLLNEKADADTTYNKTEVDGLLNKKVNTTDYETYKKSNNTKVNASVKSLTFDDTTNVVTVTKTNNTKSTINLSSLSDDVPEVVNTTTNVEANGCALNAVQNNPSVDGTLANQLKILNTERGYLMCKKLTAPDFNTVMDSGLYYTMNGTNAPYTDPYGYLRVTRRDGSYALQEFFKATTNEAYFRVNNSNSWTSWGQIAVTNSPTLTDVALDNTIKFGYAKSKFLGESKFTNGVANEKVDIYFPSGFTIGGGLDITIASNYNYGNALGSATKSFGFMAKTDGTITQKNSVLDISGWISDCFTISNIKWDSTNSRHYITISKLVTNIGDTVYVWATLKGTYWNLITNFALGSIYTTDATIIQQLQLNVNGDIMVTESALNNRGYLTSKLVTTTISSINTNGKFIISSACTDKPESGTHIYTCDATFESAGYGTYLLKEYNTGSKIWFSTLKNGVLQSWVQLSSVDDINNQGYLASKALTNFDMVYNGKYIVSHTTALADSPLPSITYANWSLEVTHPSQIATLCWTNDATENIHRGRQFKRVYVDGGWTSWTEIGNANKEEIPFPFNSGYSANGGYAYKVTKLNGYVQINVLFKKDDGSAMTNYHDIGTLPLGYRPPENLCQNGYASTSGGVEILNTGIVRVNVPNATLFSVNFGFFI